MTTVTYFVGPKQKTTKYEDSGELEKMQTMKETASAIAASAKSGMDKTKATLEEKKKEGKINQADHNAAMKESAGTGTGLGLGSATNSTTGNIGHSTGTHQMSALPGHGTGEPTGEVVEGTAVTKPIGTNTGTGRTTAHNSRVGGGGATGYGYGTGGGYSG